LQKSENTYLEDNSKDVNNDKESASIIEDSIMESELDTILHENRELYQRDIASPNFVQGFVCDDNLQNDKDMHSFLPCISSSNLHEMGTVITTTINSPRYQLQFLINNIHIMEYMWILCTYGCNPSMTNGIR
jgi:hypothetical protein